MALHVMSERLERSAGRRAGVQMRLRHHARRGWPHWRGRSSTVRRVPRLQHLPLRRGEVLLGRSLALRGRVSLCGRTLCTGLRGMSLRPGGTIALHRTRESHRCRRRIRPHSRQLGPGQRPPAVAADGCLLAREGDRRTWRSESRHHRTIGNRAWRCPDARSRIHSKDALSQGRDGWGRGRRPRARHAPRQSHTVRANGLRGSKYVTRNDGHGTRDFAVDIPGVGDASPIHIARTERQPTNTSRGRPRATNSRAADPRHQRGRIDRTHSASFRHPTPTIPAVPPTPVVKGRESPGLVIDPAPSPGRDPRPVP